jgi:hypothetical protein
LGLKHHRNDLKFNLDSQHHSYREASVRMPYLPQLSLRSDFPMISTPGRSKSTSGT